MTLVATPKHEDETPRSPRAMASPNFIFQSKLRDINVGDIEYFLQIQENKRSTFRRVANPFELHDNPLKPLFLKGLPWPLGGCRTPRTEIVLPSLRPNACPLDSYIPPSPSFRSADPFQGPHLLLQRLSLGVSCPLEVLQGIEFVI